MADGEPKAPVRRRTRKPAGPSSSDDGRHDEDGADRRSEPAESDRRGDEGDRAPSTTDGGSGGTPQVDAGLIARRAAHLVATLSGRRPESVISIERKNGEWLVGVEVVEVSRIPDSADVLAVYDVRLDDDGDLRSYRRTRRYARGQMDCERQR